MARFDVFGRCFTTRSSPGSRNMVPGLNPWHALFTVHADALGHDRVRLIDDRIVFADPADQLLACGVWQVAARSKNGKAPVSRSPSRRRCRPDHAARAGSAACEDGAWAITRAGARSSRPSRCSAGLWSGIRAGRAAS
jgi:hypothetical protein